MKRRAAVLSPLFFPDQIVSSKLASSIVLLLTRYARGRLLDVGSGRAPYRRYLSLQLESYTALDLEPAPEVDVVGSALALPFEEAQFDTIFSSQVLEHVTDPQLMLRELARVVVVGGHVIVSAPQYWPEHEVPFDFYRFTIHGLRKLGENVGLEIVEEQRQGGGFAVAGQAINNVLAERMHFGDTSVLKVRKLLLAGVLFPVFAIVNVLFGALDRLVPSRDDTLNLAVVYRRLR